MGWATMIVTLVAAACVYGLVMSLLAESIGWTAVFSVLSTVFVIAAIAVAAITTDEVR